MRIAERARLGFGGAWGVGEEIWTKGVAFELVFE